MQFHWAHQEQTAMHVPTSDLASTKDNTTYLT